MCVESFPRLDAYAVEELASGVVILLCWNVELKAPLPQLNNHGKCVSPCKLVDLLTCAEGLF